MTLKRLTKEQLLADISKRFDEGYAEATAERVKSIAERTTDTEFLRRLVSITCDALTNPKPRKSGRPRKGVVVRSDGVIDLGATPPKTRKETLRAVRDLFRDEALRDEIANSKAGVVATIDLAAQKHGVSVGKAKQLHYGKRSKKP